MSASLKLKTLENIGYNALARVVMFIFQAVANIILAQNLSSTDFGVYGFAMIFISFLSQFSDLGINSAAVQKAELDEKGLYTGFTIKIIMGVLIFIVSFLISPLSELFINNNDVPNVMRLLSLNFLINSFAFLPNSMLMRDLNYKRLFVPQVGAAIATSILSIVLALNGFQYWSIVLANIGSNIAFVVILNIMKPMKIKIRFDRKIASEFLHFGGNIFLSGLVIFAILNTDNFVIGAVRGSEMLGYYSIAFNWGFLACTTVSTVVLGVLFPTFSKMQHDRARIKSAYLKTMEYIGFIGIISNMGLLILSRDFLFFILGNGTDKWLPALTAFRILCIYGMAGTILVAVGPVVLSLGKAKLQLKTTLLAAIPQLVLLYPAILYFGIEGVAIVVTLCLGLQYFIYFPALKKEIGLEFTEVLGVLKPAIFAGSIILALEYFVFSRIFNSSYMNFWIKLFLIAAGYTLLFLIFTKFKVLKEIKEIISNIQQKRKHEDFYTKSIVPDRFREHIGDYTYGKPNIIDNGKGDILKIGNFCSISDNVTILLGREHRTDWITTYPFPALPEEWPSADLITGHPSSKGNIIIGNDVWIGYNATILSGVNIGDGAVIGAFSLVAKNVEPYTIVAGNPATIIRKRFDDDTIQFLMDLKWWNWPIEKIKDNIAILCSPHIEHLIDQNGDLLNKKK